MFQVEKRSGGRALAEFRYSLLDEHGTEVAVYRLKEDAVAAADAARACELLVAAYKGGDGCSSVDWEDLDLAHEVALKSLEERGDSQDGDC